MITQIKYARQIGSLLGYPFINHESYEADDILGMISKYAFDNDIDMIIASSDKDLYQLINDNVFIFSPRGKEIIDSTWLQEKYRLNASQWIEMKMLMGDPSDNIPGIGGIGEITAVRLLQQYQTIDNIYNSLGQLKPSLRDALQSGKEKLPLMRELVTIITDYNIIHLQASMLERNEVYADELFKVLEDLELPSLHNVMEYSLLIDKL